MYVIEDEDWAKEFPYDDRSIDGYYMSLYGFLSYSTEINFSCFDYKGKYNKRFPSPGSYLTPRFRKGLEDFLRGLFE